MKRLSNAYIYYQDRLKVCWKDKASGQLFTQGKRVGKDCPLSREEVRCYVKNGPVFAVKTIKDSRNLSLAQALLLLNLARYGQETLP